MTTRAELDERQAARICALRAEADSWEKMGAFGQSGRVLTETQKLVTPRWYPLFPHQTQVEFALSQARVNLVVAGRRSGKTERMKRKGFRLATGPQPFPSMRYYFAAPTHKMAKDLYWHDLKSMTAPWMHRKQPSETERTLFLWNGVNISVVGMNEPQRIEGKEIDWWGGDELGQMKATAWPYSVRPGLDTPGRPGRAVMIGKPVGRNHWWEYYNFALSPESGDEWRAFHWTSEEVQTPDVIAAAKRDMDPRAYAQEYLAQFLMQEGRVYHCFDREVHAIERLEYDPNLDLICCFDFNRKPGVCAICQEQPYGGSRLHRDGEPVTRQSCVAPWITAVIDEVFINADCTTATVCREIIRKWGRGGRNHQQRVICDGDPTGGAAGSQAVEGSNWSIARDVLKTEWPNQVRMRHATGSPSIVARVNATNKRMLDAAGVVHALVDPSCSALIRDLEEVSWLPGTNEIDKPKRGEEGLLTHISDGWGYYIVRKFPAQGAARAVRQVL